MLVLYEHKKKIIVQAFYNIAIICAAEHQIWDWNNEQKQ